MRRNDRNKGVTQMGRTANQTKPNGIKHAPVSSKGAQLPRDGRATGREGSLHGKAKQGRRKKEHFTSTTKPNLCKTCTPLCLDVLISLIFIQKVPSEAEPKE